MEGERGGGERGGRERERVVGYRGGRGTAEGERWRRGWGWGRGWGRGRGLHGAVRCVRHGWATAWVTVDVDAGDRGR